jgi:hypothetical protein
MSVWLCFSQMSCCWERKWQIQKYSDFAPTCLGQVSFFLRSSLLLKKSNGTMSDSELRYEWRFTANQFVLVKTPWDSWHSNFIFQLNTCGYSPYVTSSLTKGWVCCLQSLLVLTSTVILRSESHRTHDHILLSQIRDSPNLERQVPVFISPRNRVAWLYPQALGSLFVTSYNSQGFSRGIRPYLHTGEWDYDDSEFIFIVTVILKCVLNVTKLHAC